MPVRGSADVEMMMAVWTPGSYLVREYAQASRGDLGRRPDGAALELSKVRKNRWKVTTGGAGESRSPIASTRGRCPCRETGSIDSFALLNGAATFLTLAGRDLDLMTFPSCSRPPGVPA